MEIIIADDGKQPIGYLFNKDNISVDINNNDNGINPPVFNLRGIYPRYLVRFKNLLIAN
jgi:hypothetical protein